MTMTPEQIEGALRACQMLEEKAVKCRLALVTAGNCYRDVERCLAWLNQEMPFPEEAREMEDKLQKVKERLYKEGV